MVIVPKCEPVQLGREAFFFLNKVNNIKRRDDGGDEEEMKQK